MELLKEVWTFLTTTGNADRILGLIIAFLVALSVACTFIYYTLDIFFDFLKTIFSSFKINRKDRIVEVPKYVTPPKNEEMDKYLAILKKIADDYNAGIKL